MRISVTCFPQFNLSLLNVRFEELANVAKLPGHKLADALDLG